MTSEGKLVMSGVMLLSRNSATHFGAGLAIRDSKASFVGYTHFIDNVAKHGGGIFVEHGNVALRGSGSFAGNSATNDSGFGGAIHAHC